LTLPQELPRENAKPGTLLQLPSRNQRVLERQLARVRMLGIIALGAGGACSCQMSPKTAVASSYMHKLCWLTTISAHVECCAINRHTATGWRTQSAGGNARSHCCHACAGRKKW